MPLAINTHRTAPLHSFLSVLVLTVVPSVSGRAVRQVEGVPSRVIRSIGAFCGTPRAALFGSAGGA